MRRDAELIVTASHAFAAGDLETAEVAEVAEGTS